jgi:hypothetical protein
MQSRVIGGSCMPAMPPNRDGARQVLLHAISVQEHPPQSKAQSVLDSRKQWSMQITHINNSNTKYTKANRDSGW